MYLLWVESRPSGELSALKGPVEVLLRNLRVDGYLRGSAARTLVKCLDSDRASALRIILGVCKEEEGLAVRMWGALELLRDMPGWGEAMNDLIARQKNDNARAILTTLRDKSQSAPAVVSPGR